MNTDADIHNVHPYPCKFPGWVVAELVAGGGEVLLDPFCGSGTTLLEGARAGWKRVYGFDSNPIATLIARFKLADVGRPFWVTADALLSRLTAAKIRRAPRAILSFPGDEHWFDRDVLAEIARVVGWIAAQDRDDIREWLRLSLSRIVNRVSRQDSETRYVAVARDIRPGETIERFIESCEVALEALRARGPLRADATVACADVRAEMPLEDCSVDRIVTSPPYANTMDYYLYHKQRMNVLGFSFKQVQNAEIGSRHEYSSLRAPKAKWDRDYGAALREFYRVLKPGGSAFLIIGDSQIAGEKIDAAALTRRLTRTVGFQYEVLDTVSLQGRSRSFQRGFQRPNKNEHTILLTRPAAASNKVRLAPAVAAIQRSEDRWAE